MKGKKKCADGGKVGDKKGGSMPPWMGNKGAPKKKAKK